MFTIDPLYRFIIGIVVTVAIGVSAGTLNLTNAIPHDYIPAVTAWCGIIAFVGSSITTTISGLGMSTANRIAAAAASTDVQQIITSPPLAAAIPSDKVVAAPVAPPGGKP